MKHIFIFLILLSIGSFFAQNLLIIHVFDRTEQVCMRKTSIDSTLSNPDFTNETDTAYSKYVIDLEGLTSSYFVNNVFISELPISLDKTMDDQLKISILEEGFDYGLLVRATSFQENVTWYWFLEDQTTVKKINRFYIEKPS